MHAYAETYLDDAMKNLGEALDYAINACQVKADDFMFMFIASGLAEAFGRGNPKYVAGMSGTELAIEVLSRAGRTDFPEPQVDYGCSPEYWCGWVMAYYQWATGRTFRDILENVPVEEWLRLYSTMHEASEDRCVAAVNRLIARKNAPTRLQRRRQLRGLTQKELAARAEVNLRTLQQYEQKSKDINKAAAGCVRNLAWALDCCMEDLLEYAADAGEE